MQAEDRINTTSPISPQHGGPTNLQGAGIVLAVSTALLIGIAVVVVTAALPHRLRIMPIPYTATMLVLGGLVSLLISTGRTAPHLSEGLVELEAITPSVLFAVFIPALITPSGLKLKWHVVAKVLPQVFLLAIFGTLANVVLITMMARYVLPYDWIWAEAWLFGAVLGAIDPVAVVALMHGFSASTKLATMIEGESLLNDGVAYLLLEIFLGWAAGDPVHANEVVKFCFKAALGGPALGIAWALALTALLSYLFEQATVEVMASVIAAYLLWLVSDEMLHVSGILALVLFGVFLGAFGKYKVSRSASSHFSFFWDFVEWTAQTLLFFLSGLIIINELYRSGNVITGRDFGYTVAMFVLLIVIRSVVILLCFPLLRIGKHYGATWRDAFMLSWAGLRGSVGLILALEVYNSSDIRSVEYRVLVFFHVSFIVVLTVLVQGSTTGWFLKFLGYTSLPPAKHQAMVCSAEAVEALGKATILEARKDTDALLGEADWDSVERLTDMTMFAESVRKRPVLGERGPSLATSTQLVDIEGRSRSVLKDLRTRLLHCIGSQYEEAFEKEYISSEEQFRLQGSVAQAVDEAEHGLHDWRVLRRDMLSIKALQGGKGAWLARAKLALTQGYVSVCSAASRDAVLCAALASSHAAAQRELKIFVEMEYAGMVRGEHAEQEPQQCEARRRTGSVSEAHSSRREHAHDGQDVPLNQDIEAGANKRGSGIDDIKPFWKAEEDEGGIATIWEFQIDPGELEDCSRNTKDRAHALMACLDGVLRESREEQRAAQDYLEKIKRMRPEAVREARTVHVTIKTLRRGKQLLQHLRAAGLLETKETEDSLKWVGKKMKHMHNVFQVE